MMGEPQNSDGNDDINNSAMADEQMDAMTTVTSVMDGDKQEEID